MLISDLKNSIVNKDIRNFHIFTGDEEGIMGIYTKQIAKCLGLTIKWVDSIKDVADSLNLKSLVKVKYLYLVRQDNAFIKEERLWEFIKNGIIGNYIILIQPNMDTRTKFFKFFEQDIVVFNKLSQEMLSKYAKKYCPDLSGNNVEKLCSWCGNSYSRLINELDKISTLSKQTGIENDKSFDILDKECAIFKEKQFDVFKYVDFIMKRNVFACYKELQYVKSQKCEILLVSLLMTAFRSLLLLKLDGGGAGVCDRTGLTGWQVKNAIEVKDSYNTQECENILLFLQETEAKIKTGKIIPDITLDYILAEIL